MIFYSSTLELGMLLDPSLQRSSNGFDMGCFATSNWIAGERDGDVPLWAIRGSGGGLRVEVKRQRVPNYAFSPAMILYDFVIKNHQSSYFWCRSVVDCAAPLCFPRALRRPSRHLVQWPYWDVTPPVKFCGGKTWTCFENSSGVLFRTGFHYMSKRKL